jgi:CheY-like chemotaxis protein
MNHALRILLLDDDAFMLDLLADMIHGLGYPHVHADTDARHALKALPVFRPDLLICDLSMPDMDGIEFLRSVAEGGFDGSVILLSGMDSGILRAAEILAMAQGLTILGARSKPLPHAALAELLRVAGDRSAPVHGGAK